MTAREESAPTPIEPEDATCDQCSCPSSDNDYTCCYCGMTHDEIMQEGETY